MHRDADTIRVDACQVLTGRDINPLVLRSRESLGGSLGHQDEGGALEELPTM